MNEIPDKPSAGVKTPRPLMDPVVVYDDNGRVVAVIEDLPAPTAAEWLGGRDEDFYGEAAA